MKKRIIVKIDKYEAYSFESSTGETLYNYQYKGQPWGMADSNFTVKILNLIEEAASDRFYAKHGGKNFGSWNKLMTLQKQNYASICDEVAKQLKN